MRKLTPEERAAKRAISGVAPASEAKTAPEVEAVATEEVVEEEKPKRGRKKAEEAPSEAEEGHVHDENCGHDTNTPEA